MDNFFNMVEIQAALFIYLIVGVIARKRTIITRQGIQSFTDYIVKIALPCMIFMSFNQELTPQKMKYAAASLTAAFAVSFFSMFLGKFLFRHVEPKKQSILRYATIISNAGFAGLPLVTTAFGIEAAFYASIFIIPSRIFMWSAGITLFTGTSSGNQVKTILLNPGIVAVVLGLIRMVFNIPVPYALGNALQNIGSTTTALSIFVVGAILAEVDVRTVFEPYALYLSFVRLLLLPGLLLAAFKLIGADPLLTAAGVILVGMPAGATTALLAQKYNADYQFGSKCVFVTTVFSLVTVPILTLFL